MENKITVLYVDDFKRLYTVNNSKNELLVMVYFNKKEKKVEALFDCNLNLIVEGCTVEVTYVNLLREITVERITPNCIMSTFGEYFNFSTSLLSKVSLKEIQFDDGDIWNFKEGLNNAYKNCR